MKKFLSALLAGSLIFSLSSCSNIKNKPSPDSQPTAETTAVPADLKTLTETYASDMADGAFTSVADHFSVAVKAKTNSEKLKKAWDTQTAGYGKFQKIVKSTEIKKDTYTTVLSVLQFENDGLRISITYNSSGEIDGLYFYPYTILSSLVSNSAYEETAIQIGDSVHPLDGILTLPKNVKNPPVAILIQGSGQSDLNETVGKNKNKPFQDIARGLAEKGIASIRYNKRIYQYPELAEKTMTIQDEVLNDAGSALLYAKNLASVNSKKIFVIGHSLGGIMAPKIALDNKDVAGIVSMAGSPRKLEDIIADQNKNLGATDEQMKEVKTQVNQIKNLTGTEDTVLLGINSHYWYSLNQIESSSIAKQLTIPMMFLQGSDDFQVYPDIDFDGWKSLLSSKKNVTFHEYDNLNHLFMQSNGKKDITEYDVVGHVDSGVIKDIASFINEH